MMPARGAKTSCPRLLVTGVSGLLGLNLALQASRGEGTAHGKALARSGATRERFQVTGVLRGARAAAVPGATPFAVIAADLTQPGQIERVLEASQPDLIINCAAQAEVDRCERYPEEAYQVNTWMPEMLARAAVRNGVRLMHISTDAVFDGLRGDYTEEDAPTPNNTYARTKLEAERRVSDAHPEALIARMNFYGWSWHGQRSLAEYFFNHLAAGAPVPGFTDLVFCPLLVNDLVEILLQMLDSHLTGIYHVVSPEALSKYSFGRMVARHFGFDEALVVPASCKTSGLMAPRSPLLTLRIEKLARALGFAKTDAGDSSGIGSASAGSASAWTLPMQEPSMRRFLELYHQGYPRVLRSVLVKPADTPRYAGEEIT